MIRTFLAATALIALAATFSGPAEAYQVKLKKVMITSYQMNGAGSDAAPSPQTNNVARAAPAN